MKHDTSYLLTVCEQNFRCQNGASRAYMEFMRPDRPNSMDPDDLVRLIYVTYAVKARSFKAAESWMVENVITPLSQQGGKYLYWRKKFFVREHEEDPGRLVLKVRLGVLNKDYQAVEIRDMIKGGDDPYPILDPRLDEGGKFFDVGQQRRPAR